MTEVDEAMKSPPQHWFGDQIGIDTKSWHERANLAELSKLDSNRNSWIFAVPSHLFSEHQRLFFICGITHWSNSFQRTSSVDSLFSRIGCRAVFAKPDLDGIAANHTRSISKYPSWFWSRNEE
jgi:hypothetical protein